jgi:hypothetical protein
MQGVKHRGLARGDRERPLNDGQIPNPNVVRVATGTGYHRVEGNRRASRNGPRERSLTPKSLKSRFRNFCIRCTCTCTTHAPVARHQNALRVLEQVRASARVGQLERLHLDGARAAAGAALRLELGGGVARLLQLQIQVVDLLRSPPISPQYSGEKSCESKHYRVWRGETETGLERGTYPKHSRRACSPRYGLQS